MVVLGCGVGWFCARGSVWAAFWFMLVVVLVGV